MGIRIFPCKNTRWGFFSKAMGGIYQNARRSLWRLSQGIPVHSRLTQNIGRVHGGSGASGAGPPERRGRGESGLGHVIAASPWV